MKGKYLAVSDKAEVALFFTWMYKLEIILETDKNGKDEIYYLQSTLRAWYLDMREKLLEDYQNGRFTILPEGMNREKRRKEG